jgi:quercetin 2,3-dioxygenase
VLFRDGDEVTLRSGDTGVRFLLVSGAPLGEPISWGGPIVMNTRAELQRALDEYRNGTFVKVGRGGFLRGGWNSGARTARSL